MSYGGNYGEPSWPSAALAHRLTRRTFQAAEDRTAADLTAVEAADTVEEAEGTALEEGVMAVVRHPQDGALGCGERQADAPLQADTEEGEGPVEVGMAGEDLEEIAVSASALSAWLRCEVD